VLLLGFLLIAQLNRTPGFVDIPSAPAYDIPGMWGGGIVFSMPMFNEDPNPNDNIKVDPADFDMVFRYGLGGKGEISLSMFTLNTYVGSFKYLIKKQEGNAPIIFGGIEDISYSTHISTIGMKGKTGSIEEKTYHLYMNGRPWELFSAYIAMQKPFSPMFNIVIGFGRGRFVGYGWRSHIFNTDFLVLGEEYTTRSHSWWAFGLFMGGSVKFPFGLEMSVEMDGRDANIGLKYHSTYVTPTLALCKVEYLGSGFRPWSPRWTFGLESSNRAWVGPPKVGSIECIVQDITKKTLLQNAVVDIKEINKRYTAVGGTFSLSLPADNYTVTVSKKDYVDYIAKISVKAGVRTKMVFNLKKTEEAIKRELAAQERERSIKNYLEQGKIYFSEGNLNEAKSAFEIVVSLDPDNVEAKDYLTKLEARRQELISAYSTEARTRAGAKDFTKAIEFWKKVLALDPTSAEAKTSIADLQKQIAAIKRPPTTPPPKPPEKKATAEEIDALYKKGVSLFTAEKYDDALKVFNQVLALDPNHKGAKDYKKRTEARLKALKGG